eukprot:CAMPEP_0202073230 /NCGR_PEP_ID=MMETSP0964-20121228/2903_1 /ASSEMBLY_ACC=CAM_ASM_000500 /TAXON_ID=4773 /ORGANISM="Schizochytrium aggregatum, Strain ATCC28209" /LENGTH=190 /DNA_ID=CAMNT_0048640313 /DNA_START=53 /DNA_END=625 /DNA_ORIENTATION=+
MRGSSAAALALGVALVAAAPARAEEGLAADVKEKIEATDGFEIQEEEAPPAGGASEDGPPQPDPEEMARLAKLFEALSPDCRTEIEAAFKGEGELTDGCKAEVQAFMSTQVAPDGANPGAAAEDNGEPKSDPRPTIFGFVLLMFAGLIGWGVYAQTALVSQIPEAPKKKLSKQKLLKQKMKEQREQQAMQ